MVCRITNRHSVKYAELRIGILLKMPICNCHITQTDTETETEANFTHPSVETKNINIKCISIGYT